MTNHSTKKTVLLVDDDPDFLLQQKIKLEAAGLDVVTAENEKEAESTLETNVPDLAVVDLMMEHADAGFTLCYHIKKRDPAIPVILISSVNDETGLDFDATTELERSWMKADAFLAKPVRFEQLKLEIERLMRE